MKMKKFAVVGAAICVSVTLFCGCGDVVKSLVSEGKWESGDKETQKEERDLSSFDKIKVDVGLADVSIAKGDGYHLGISRTEGYAIISEVKDNELLIHSDGDAKGIVSATLTITVPGDAVLGSVDVKVGLGDISVKEVSIEDLHIDTGNGDCDITGCELGAADIKAAVGDVTIIKSGTTEDTAFSLSADVGDIEIDGSEVESPYKSGDGEKSIYVKASVGDISVSQ